MHETPTPRYPVNVESFVSVKLKRNYRVWKEQMERLIENHGMLGFIDGEIREPSQEFKQQVDDVDGERKEIRNPDYVLWRGSDRLVQGWILGALNEELTSELLWCQIANLMWSWLQARYDPNGDEVSPDGEGEEAGHGKYLTLYTAVMQSDWDSAKRFLDQEMDAAITPINSCRETTLHVADGTNRDSSDSSNRDIGFVKNLVNFIMECKDKHSLAYQDKKGDTALHAAAKAGNTKAAMILVILVDRNPSLLYIENKYGALPIHAATVGRKRDILVYFISLRQLNSASWKEIGTYLWELLVSYGFTDLATELVEAYPDITGGLKECTQALNIMVHMPSIFRSGASLNCLQRLIYSCAPLQSKKKSESTRISGYIEHQLAHSYAVFLKFHFALWKIIGELVPPMKNIQDQKSMHQQAPGLVEHLVDKIACLSD